MTTPEGMTALEVAKKQAEREAESPGAEARDKEEAPARETTEVKGKMPKEEESKRSETEDISAQVTTLQASEEPQQQQPNAAAIPGQNSDAQELADSVVTDPEQLIDVSNLQTLEPMVAATANAAGSAAPVGGYPSLSTIAAIADIQKRLIRASESLSGDPVIAGSHLPDDFDINEINPIPSRVKRDWHRNVLTAHRMRLIKELFQTLFSTTELPVILDRHTCSMMLYSKKVESSFFEAAESRSKYYHLLAEKIYKLQLEFAEKVQKHKARVGRIGQLLRTGIVTFVGESLPVRVRQLIQEQRQPDNRPQQQRPSRQAENLRVNPMHSPQRRRQPPLVPSAPQPAPQPALRTYNLPVDSLLDQREQRILQDWHTKQRLQLIFESQQMEQMVPNSLEYYDDDDFSALSM